MRKSQSCSGPLALPSQLVDEIGKRITNITGDEKEKAYLFQQLSMALQRGKGFLFKVLSLSASPCANFQVGSSLND